MKTKRTFLMNADHYEMVKGLSDAQLGLLLRALYALAADEPLPELDAVSKMAFAFMANDITKANEKYEARCEKNREAIAKRWGKTNTNESETIQSNTIEYECTEIIQSNTNEYECIEKNTIEYNRIQSNTSAYLYDNDHDDDDDDINNINININNNNKDSSIDALNLDTTVDNKDSSILKLTTKKEKEKVEKEKEKEKTALVKSTTNKTKVDKEARARKFYDRLLEYLPKYGAPMLREFYDYWTESNEQGALMRFEMERVFDISRRLATWASRAKQKQNNGGNYGTNNYKTATERLRDEYNECIEGVLAKYRK